MAVVTTAFVGAGAVALGTAHAVPDHTPKLSDQSFDRAALTSDATRAQDAGRANRGTARTDAQTLADQGVPELWMTPLKKFTISNAFGNNHADSVHPGVDLVAPSGTPFYAVHAGTVKLARYNGGYGYSIMIDLGGGVTLVYGHAAKLYVHEGAQVQAGDMIGLVGDTGFAYGAQLHFEVRLNDQSVEPVGYLTQYGVDLRASAQNAAS